MSGCGLVLSRNVGARLDLASARNAIIVEPRRADQLAAGLLAAAAMDEPSLRSAEQESVLLASGFGPAVFAASLKNLLNALADPQQRG